MPGENLKISSLKHFGVRHLTVCDLLKILSQGSDPNAIQGDFEKLFDAINRVTFDEQDRKMIKSIH